uniref:Uncharacterized protein n=1 Tax=Oryza rufipogon TaxID=4529 RepID=A0A0E0NAB7_ORYRU
MARKGTAPAAAAATLLLLSCAVAASHTAAAAAAEGSTSPPAAPQLGMPRSATAGGGMRTKMGLRRPPPRRHSHVSDIGIYSASTSSFCLVHVWLDHPFQC